jgi:uncharacterized protein (TIGR00156 family)
VNIRKSIVFIASAIVLAGALSAAAAVCHGGFGSQKVHPNDSVVTPADKVAPLPEDTDVVLKGQIIAHIGGDTYEFRDSSGVLHVEIGETDWKGFHVTSKDTVMIFGDKDSKKKEGSFVDASLVVPLW